MQTKESLRQLMRQKLQAQSPGDRKKKSLIIEEKLFSLDAFKKASVVCFYVSLPAEVDTAQMIDRALEAGKRVLVPRVNREAQEPPLQLYEIKDRQKDLEKGAFGIMEPLPSRTRLADAQEIGCVIAPGVAFDRANHRLGRGKGFYDRFLAGIGPGVAKIGVAFSFQIVDEVPRVGHDVRLDLVITD